jgi:hypothetical protein
MVGLMSIGDIFDNGDVMNFISCLVPFCNRITDHKQIIYIRNRQRFYDLASSLAGPFRPFARFQFMRIINQNALDGKFEMTPIGNQKYYDNLPYQVFPRQAKRIF